MLIRYMFLAAALLPSALPCRAAPAAEAGRLAKDGRFLSARLALVESPETADKSAFLDRLDRHVAALREKEDASFAERCYLDGYLLWTRGELEEARRSWARFLALKKVDGRRSFDARAHEVAELWEKTRPRPVAPPSVEPLPSEPEKPAAVPRKPRPKKKVYARKNRRRSPAPAAPVAADTARFLASAETARRSGHYDEALRYYRLVQRIDPDSADARRGIEAVEKETR